LATASYKTIKTLTATAGQSVFNFALDYLRKPFIQMSINGVSKTYSTDYSISGQELTYPTGCATGDIVVIKRTTSTDRIVTWNDASVLRASDLTVFETQLLHIQEELSDAVQTDAADEALKAATSAAEAAALLASMQATLDAATLAATLEATNQAATATTKALEAATSALEAAANAETAASVVNTSFRNKIINGNFDIWQRGTSQTNSGYGSADRWHCTNTGTTKNVSIQSFQFGQTEVPNNPKYFMRHVVTSVTGTGNFCILQQKIEDVTLLSGKTVTVSFYARAASAKNIAVDFYQNFGTSGSTGVTNIGITSIALTTTWKKYILTITLPSVSGMTIGANSYTDLRFWFDCGSVFDSNINALIGQQSGTFDIAQVQLEEGSVATNFEQRPIGIEWSLCYRYYEYGNAVIECYGAASQSLSMTPYFKVIKRAVPTIVVTDNSSVYTTGVFSALELDTRSFRLKGTKDTNAGAFIIRALWYADAEL